MTRAALPASPASPRRRARLRAAALAAGIVAACAGAEAAAAEAPESLREGNRSLYFLVGAGPSVGIGRGACYGGSYYWGPNFNDPDYRGALSLGCGGAIKLAQEFGVHFSGRASGPALALLTQQELLSYGYFGFVVAPKFVYDIQVIKGVAFFIAPNVALGYHRSAWRGYRGVHGADIQGGIAAKLIIQDRLVIWAELPHFDFVFGPTYFIPRYDFLLGGGVTF